MIEGRQLKDWLRKITKDQNLEDIDDLTNTPINGFRRWFRSAELSPTLNMGYYDSLAGVYVLGRYREPAMEYIENTTSAALYTLTSGATERITIIFCSSRNATRAHAVDATASATAIIDGGATIAQNRDLVLIGGATEDPTNTAIPRISGPITIEQGETFTTTDISFVAADVKSIKLIIKRETIA